MEKNYHGAGTSRAMSYYNIYYIMKQTIVSAFFFDMVGDENEIKPLVRVGRTDFGRERCIRRRPTSRVSPLYSSSGTGRRRRHQIFPLNLLYHEVSIRTSFPGRRKIKALPAPGQLGLRKSFKRDR